MGLRRNPLKPYQSAHFSAHRDCKDHLGLLRGGQDVRSVPVGTSGEEAGGVEKRCRGGQEGGNGGGGDGGTGPSTAREEVWGQEARAGSAGSRGTRTGTEGGSGRVILDTGSGTSHA